MNIILEAKPYRQHDDDHSIGKVIVGPYTVEASPVNPKYNIKITKNGKTVSTLGTQVDAVKVSKLFNGLENDNIDTVEELIDRVEYHLGEEVYSDYKRSEKVENLCESFNVSTPNFEAVTDEYMPRSGEGDNKLTQLLVAANKIIYRWYNDGDVIDSSTGLSLGDDISGSANWIDKYMPSLAKSFKNVYDSFNDDTYEKTVIIPFEKTLEKYFSTEDWKKLLSEPKVGNAYRESGEYYWEFPDDEEEYYESRAVKENYIDNDDTSYLDSYDDYDEYESFAEIPEQKPIRYKGFSIYKGIDDNGAETYYCFYNNDDYPEPGYEDWSADTLEQAKEWCDYYEFDNDDNLE